MKYVILCLSLLALVSCYEFKRGSTVKSGSYEFETICIDNVEYIYWASGHVGYMAPHLKTDGKPYTCE